VVKKKGGRKKSITVLKRGSDIGRLVAEDDTNLKSYYVGREFYLDRALDMEDPIIFYMGPKGIGKSAVLQMIRLEKAHDVKRIINLSPDDLAFSAFANFKIESPIVGDIAKGQWLFKCLWDYVLLMELWERENSGVQDRWSKFKKLFRSRDEKRIQRLFNITITDQGKAISLTDRILQLIKEVELSAQSQKVGISGSVKVEPAGSGQFQLLSEINHAVKTLPSILRNEYYVLIDDLDLYWENEPSQNALIAALFLSLRRLSRNPVKFVVSIREDIYRCLPLADKDKSRDRLCRMEWDLKNIKEMMERRIVTTLKCSPHDIWGNLFPENHFEVLAKYSTLKPRELIRLVGLCMNRAVINDHKRVHDEDIAQALRQYSIERIGDLVSEYSFVYPKLDIVLQKFFGGKKEFSFKTLDVIATELAVDALEHGNFGMPWQWAGGFDERAEDFAHLLIDIGFLKVKVNRTAIPQRYNSSVMGPINSIMWFAVHPMYAPGLSLLGT
jgi:ABC-type phosphate transport system ATPase subunit